MDLHWESGREDRTHLDSRLALTKKKFPTRASCASNRGMNSSDSGYEIDFLYGRYRGMVFRRCLSLLGDKELAKEATQDVFLQVIRSLPGFRGECSPLTWIYRIATTHCLRLIKRQGLFEAYQAECLETETNVLLPKIGAIDARRALLKLYRGLDPLSREVFVYAYVDELSQDEIAGIVGKSRKTVGKRLGRIRHRLALFTTEDTVPIESRRETYG